MNISVKMTNATNAQYHGVSVGSFVSMDVEEYLRGVVPVEMNPDPVSTQKHFRVQAIAARTFALYMNAYNPKISRTPAVVRSLIPLGITRI